MGTIGVLSRKAVVVLLKIIVVGERVVPVLQNTVIRPRLASTKFRGGRLFCQQTTNTSLQVLDPVVFEFTEANALVAVDTDREIVISASVVARTALLQVFRAFLAGNVAQRNPGVFSRFGYIIIFDRDLRKSNALVTTYYRVVPIPVFLLQERANDDAWYLVFSSEHVDAVGDFPGEGSAPGSAGHASPSPLPEGVAGTSFE